MDIKHISIPFEVKAAPLQEEDSDFGKFEGYGSVWNRIDHGGDMVQKGAFSKSLEEWKNKNQLPLMPWYHDMKSPIGDWVEMHEDEKGLYVSGQLWVKGAKRIDNAVMVHNMLTGTGPKAMSIGYAVKDYEIMENDVRLLKEIELFELSIVPFGMDPHALVTQAKSLVDGDGKLVDIRTFEKTLRYAGLSRTQAKTLVSGGYKALCDKDALEDNEGKNRDDSSIDEDVLASLQTLFK